MDNQITIKKNPHGDTRTAPKDTTFEQFHDATVNHIQEVRQVLTRLGSMLKTAGLMHDRTKLEYESEFYRNFMDALNNGIDFTTNTWYQKHIDIEKHHPFSKCHEDITLLDIIETIADCVCAGMARSGEIRPLEFNDDILHKAVENTVKMIHNMLKVEE